MRKIAIISDVHALLEPLEAVLADMKKRGIDEIYSLGDNIGVGPNPSEVLELLEQYGVKSIRGNSEEYCLLGTEAFDYVHYNESKRRSQEWTLAQLSEEQVKRLKLFPVFYELLLGGKRLALCHIANDIRFDYRKNSTWSYQSKLMRQPAEASRQFRYTNSPQQKDDIIKKQESIEAELARKGGNPLLSAELNALLSACAEPLFDGKTIDAFDDIIQGHVHWKITDTESNPTIHSIRAVGMAYGEGEPIDMASYVILTEKENGYDMEEVLVPFDRAKMLRAIAASSMPGKDQIEKFVKAR